MTAVDLAPDVAARMAYLSSRRWYAGKGREVSAVSLVRLPWLTSPDATPALRTELIDVSYSDGHRHVYQLPLAYREHGDAALDHAFIGYFPPEPGWGERVAYDLPYDRDAAATFMRFLSSGHAAGGMRAHVVGEIDLDQDPLVLSGEQSNTSIVYGDRMLLKLFRRVQPGRNPDIEAHQAFTRAGETVAPQLLGWLESDPDGDAEVRALGGDLGMVTQFLPSATDGWALATASVRDLLAEADLHADEVGGDFASEAERLGAVTARMHHDLADAFGTSAWAAEDLTRLTRALSGRFDHALARVPVLAGFDRAVRAVYAEVEGLTPPVTAHRVHGDFHLGQTMRTIPGWRIIDFEGEPGAPYESRVGFDSPMRDVAGLLRSIDYAAAHLLKDEPASSQSQFRASEWRARNTEAFLRGYRVETVGAQPERADREGVQTGVHPESWSANDRTLLRAYELDKAVYEAVYEADMRPDWITIPLAALERLT